MVAALAAAIVAAGLWAYSTSFAGVFALDDVRAIVRNPTIQTLWPLSTPLTPPSRSTVGGRPVANLSFAINYALAPGVNAAAAGAGSGTSEPAAAAGLDPVPFHVGNLLIHLTAALLLFGVTRRTLTTPRLAPRSGGAASWLAFAVAVVWVVHPLCTAAVTYIVQRVESLMGLFYLLTLYCAVRAAEGDRARAWTVAAIASCAAGMATKEAMVTAPVVVAIWDWCFAADSAGAPRRPRWSLLAGLAATWIVLALMLQTENRSASVDLAAATAWSYLLTQTAVILHYVKLVFVPMPQAFMYDWPLVMSWLDVAWQALLLLALATVTGWAVVRRRPAGFLGAWFFLVLAPSSSVLPVVTEVAAEHRMYLPLAAIVAFLVLGAFRAWQQVLSDGASAARGAVTAAVALAALVVALGLMTRARNDVYASAIGLWQDTVATRPADARPRVALGEALAAAGRFGEAESQLQTGVTLAPADPNARVRLGAVLAELGRYDEAIPQLERALVLRPGDADATRMLARLYAMRRPSPWPR